MTDTELFHQCRNNDAKAQRTLYDLHKAKLMGLCRRYSRSREDAKDVLQDTFIKIFSKIRQVESAEKLEGWMKSIAIRTSIDHYHKKKKAESVQAIDQFNDIEGDGYEIVIKELSDEFLINLISELPEGCRMVFNLFEVEGYNHTEISTLLNMTEGTSRSQLYYAKYLLKQKLSRSGITRYEKFA